MPSSLATIHSLRKSRAEIVEELRRLLPVLESVSAERPHFAFGLAALDAHLPGGGLAGGALHEVGPMAQSDFASAFGFVAALLACLPRQAPLVFVMPSRGLAEHGFPSGHGLAEFGIDPARLILVETQDELQALWAMEEALRSGVPAAVAGAIGRALDLKVSRRLHLAASSFGSPLILLSAAGITGASAAVTRWCVAAATAERDRFGLFGRRRWHLRLERCRNGRTGEWLVEWDHAAYRFSLAAPVADPASLDATGTQPFLEGAHRS